MRVTYYWDGNTVVPTGKWRLKESKGAKWLEVQIKYKELDSVISKRIKIGKQFFGLLNKYEFEIEYKYKECLEFVSEEALEYIIEYPIQECNHE